MLSKARLAYLCMAVFLIGATLTITFSFAKANIQATHLNAVDVAQGTGIMWNNTDCNATFAQNAYPGPQTLLPRIIMEYSDAALQFGVQSPQGLNQTLAPRIMIEYADYASFIAFPIQSYQGPPLPSLSIDSPTQQPPDSVQTYTNVTISANVTDPISEIENVTLYYNTTVDPTWHQLNMTYNSVSNLYQTTIPGQAQPCNVNYRIEAYDYRGYHAVNDNAGTYWVVPVIPEFPLIVVIALFGVSSLSVAIAYRKKRMNLS